MPAASAHYVACRAERSHATLTHRDLFLLTFHDVGGDMVLRSCECVGRLP
jgi:hypothetical protein